MLSRKDLYSKKGSFINFIGCISQANAFPIPLCIKLPQMNGYTKCFDSNTKLIDFLVHDIELLKKYNAI